MTITTGFKPSELLQNYTDWCNFVKTLNMSDELRAWYIAWDHWDFACSPMEDKDRQQRRYGHYLGWFAHITTINKERELIQEEAKDTVKKFGVSHYDGKFYTLIRKY